MLELGGSLRLERTSAAQPVFERLWQLYVHDLSESRGSVPNEEGLFKSGHLDWYRSSPREWAAFLVTDSGAPIGFAFIGLRWAGGKRTVGDFFIVRARRRSGIGRAVARALIGLYPGAWEIAFQDDNPGAPDFWRGVVRDIVGDAWSEELRAVPDKPQVAPDRWLVFDTVAPRPGRTSS